MTDGFDNNITHSNVELCDAVEHDPVYTGSAVQSARAMPDAMLRDCRVSQCVYSGLSLFCIPVFSAVSMPGQRRTSLQAVCCC